MSIHTCMPCFIRSILANVVHFYDQKYVQNVLISDGYNPKSRSNLLPSVNISTGPTYFPPAPKAKASKKMAIRAAGGTVWEDKSMMNWDVNDYRLFVGNMGNEVSSDLLSRYI